ncbi:MAG: fatty acid desaturase [Nocardioidaceae bacterium]
MDTRHRHLSSYTELSRIIRDKGLLQRRYAYYWSRIALAVAAFVVIWVGFFIIGNSWFQLVLAAALGIVVTQFGFLGHDGAHRQIFASAAWNDWTARVFAGAFAGLSYGWWKAKHNRHHAAPNQVDRDPDIAPGALAFTPDVVAEPQRFRRMVRPPAGLVLLPAADAGRTQPARREHPHPPAPRCRRAPAGRGRARHRAARRVRRWCCCWCFRWARPARSSACRWLSSGCASAGRSPPTTRECRSSRAR